MTRLAVRRSVFGLLLAALALAPAVAFAAEAILIDIERGGMPNSTGGEVAISLSEEHAATPGGISLKMAFAERGRGWVGADQLRRRDWTPFRSLRFHLHSLLGRPAVLSFVIKDKDSTSRREWAVLHFVLEPGSRDYALSLVGLRAQSGRPFDLASVSEWHFSYRFFPENDWEEKGEAALTAHLSGPRLSSEDAAAASPPPASGIQLTGKVGDAPVRLVLGPAGAGPAIDPILSAAPMIEVAAAAPSVPRKRPKMPDIKHPVMFNTPEADRIMEALQVFPPDNPWNEDISKRPVHPNSQNILASCNPNRWLWFNLDMGYIIVPPNQKRVDLKVLAYPGESDKGPYPIPDNAPVEGYPLDGKTLDQAQHNSRGDRHVLVVDAWNGMLYEFFTTHKGAGGWEADQASIFDLKSNKLRPNGWTSADAAGLPIFPAAIRFEECERGLVEHAMRVTFRRTRREFVYPATHYASSRTDPNLPRMGERLRLRKDFDTSGFSKHPKAILDGMKKYGVFCADNGMDWLISVAPDSRLKNLDELKKVRGRDFEVIVPTGPNEGPRAR